MKSILKTKRLYWSSDEKKIIFKHYEHEIKEELMKLLPQRTWRAIKNEGGKLGLERRKWSKKEDIIINECFPSISEEKILLKLPKRTWNAIRRRAYQLKVYRRSKTELKIKKLKLNLSPEQKGYIAGIIDGEGSIGFKRRHKNPYPIVVITNTSQLLIDHLQATIGNELLSYKSKRERKRENHQITYDLIIVGKNTLPLLKEVLPYLIIKKKRAMLVIEFVLLKLSHEKYNTPPNLNELEIVSEVYMLNKRGVSRQ